MKKEKMVCSLNPTKTIYIMSTKNLEQTKNILLFIQYKLITGE